MQSLNKFILLITSGILLVSCGPSSENLYFRFSENLLNRRLSDSEFESRKQFLREVFLSKKTRDSITSHDLISEVNRAIEENGGKFQVGIMYSTHSTEELVKNAYGKPIEIYRDLFNVLGPKEKTEFLSRESVWVILNHFDPSLTEGLVATRNYIFHTYEMKVEDSGSATIGKDEQN